MQLDQSAKLAGIHYDIRGPILQQAQKLEEEGHHVLAFEHDRARHDRTKEAEIRVEFDMSPARYYQVLDRVIDSPAALAYDPQLVTRLQRLRHARVTASCCRSAGDAAFGVHRLHGRNPARSAASQESWKRTFSRFASRDAHDGRQ